METLKTWLESSQSAASVGCHKKEHIVGMGKKIGAEV